MATVGIVIPAYNEGENLHRVLDAVRATDWPAQIVVVDDGSVDDTAVVAAGYAAQDSRISLLCLPQNRGKAGAMLAGVQILSTELVTFLDADLLNMRPHHLTDLCAPVLADECEMAVALFQHGSLRTDGAHKLTPILSGQRCLYTRDACAVLSGLASTGYGVETGLTLHAKRAGWRVRYILWSHVSHVMKEQKRGWWMGLRSRGRMYMQIGAVLLASLTLLWGVRTLLQGGGAVRQFFHARPPFQRALSAGLVMLMILSWFFQPVRLRAYTDLRVQELSTWDPAAYRRVLVVAPHPDDELLATGGYILSALTAPTPPEIRVVIVTNGDASYSTVLFNGQNPISRMTYRQLAAVRQTESRDGMAALGLPAGQVSFLNFPDRGMSALWQNYWKNDKPYRSPTTGLSAATQADGVEMPYTGEAFLGLVREFLAEYQPDAVILPHPRDAHADHQAVAQFFTFAIALNDAEGIVPAPHIFAYLMWLWGNPNPEGIRLDRESLRLPTKYVDDSNQWLRFPLVEEVRQGKARAAGLYQSQKRQLGAMLTRNAHSSNELFTELVQYTVPKAVESGAAPAPDQWLQLPYERVWNAVNLSLPASEPSRLWSVTDEDSLHLAVQVGRGMANQNRFRFVIRMPGPDGFDEVRIPASQFMQNGDGRFWLASLPLENLPAYAGGQVVVASLEILSGQRVVGRSAWLTLYLPSGWAD